MTTKEERLSLKKYPLPDAMDFTACSSDHVLENIAFLDAAIEEESWHVEHLAQQREKLKGRAIKEGLKESDGYYLIEIPGRKLRNPIRDIEKFREAFPDGYSRCRIMQTIELQDALMAVEKMDIPLGLADRMVGETLVTEFTGFQPQKVSVEVRKKQERLK